MRDMLKKMIQQANLVKNNAYVPTCEFPVGACIRTTNNKLFVGCNFENASWPLSLCAESSAVANMISAGEKEIAEIVIIAEKKDQCPPCGACRQRLFEFAIPEMKVHLCDKTGKLQKTFTIEELLHEGFRFKAEHLKN